MHYPTLEAAVIERARARGIDLEASTTAFLTQIREGRSTSRAGHEAFADPPVRPAKQQPARALSPAEDATMTLIASGLTEAQIADRLGKDYETVHTQKRAALQKLGAVNAAHGTALWILGRFARAA